MIIVYLLCSPGNELPGVPYVVASSFLTPILIHLALNFPHQRAVVRRIPALLYFTYGIGVGIAVVALYGYYRHSALWTYVSASITVSLGVCAGVLVVSSSIARRDAVTTLERTRATSAFWGTLVIPILIGLSMYSGRFDNILVMACGSPTIFSPVGICPPEFSWRPWRTSPRRYCWFQRC